MKWQTYITSVVTVVVFALSAITLLPRNATASASAMSACSALEGNGCCACNSGGACIEVQHDGVASCTFEFCSSTPCRYVA
jgi:hypothetical protein